METAPSLDQPTMLIPLTAKTLKLNAVTHIVGASSLVLVMQDYWLIALPISKNTHLYLLALLVSSLMDVH